MRARNDVQKCFYFNRKIAEKIAETAKRFNVSQSELIRECIERELPRLIDRESKRKN